MLVDQNKLDALKHAADEMWKLKLKAEESVQQTAEAKLVETLTQKWLRLDNAYRSAKELLAFEAEIGGEIDQIAKIGAAA